MVTSIEAVCRDGKVERLDAPLERAKTGRVVVTFITPRANVIDLAAPGISLQQAAELRAKFGAAAEDWDDPAMDVYDQL